MTLSTLYEILRTSGVPDIPWTDIIFSFTMLGAILYLMIKSAEDDINKHSNILKMTVKEEFLGLTALIVLGIGFVMDITHKISLSPAYQMYDAMITNKILNTGISVAMLVVSVLICIVAIVIKLDKTWDKLVGVTSAVMATISLSLMTNIYSFVDILKDNVLEMEKIGFQFMWIGTLLMISIAIRKLYRNNGGKTNARI